MKKTTVQNKLATLLGLEEFIVDPKTGKSKKEPKNYNAPVGISENEIQNFRAMQGVIYFLQAPELFSAKICPHCGEQFLVSRQYVAFCSYTCIAKDLESKGIKWSRKDDYDFIGDQLYEGNEPIWIRNLDRLRAILEPSNFKEGLLPQTNTAPQESSTSPRPTLSVPQLTT